MVVEQKEFGSVSDPDPRLYSPVVPRFPRRGSKRRTLVSELFNLALDPDNMNTVIRSHSETVSTVFFVPSKSETEQQPKFF